VPDAVDSDDAHNVGDFVNHPVVSDADAPIVFASHQLAAAGRARVACQSLNRCDNAVVKLS